METSIYHKNLQPVIYVTGDVAGKLDSPLYSILDLTLWELGKIPGLSRTSSSSQPDTQGYSHQVGRRMAGDLRGVPRYGNRLRGGDGADLRPDGGLVRELLTPLVILTAIPFSMVGIMPGHWLLGAFFTATSMIGFIAGAGIVVRNSIILVDFIELRLRQGSIPWTRP